MMKRVLLIVLVLLLLILLVILALLAGWMIFVPILEYRQGEELYQSIVDDYVLEGISEDESKQSILDQMGISPNFDALKELNPEVVGWIYLPDTDINYPVTQTDNNDYYLSHLVDGTSNKNGTIFVDHQNSADFSDENTVLYGHHMKSGAMFASIMKYQGQSYYEKHPRGYIITENHAYLVEFFSGFTVRADSEVYALTFSDSETHTSWIKQCFESSDFSCDIGLKENDKTVTLSTCAYSFEEARYVLIGKITELF